MVADVAKLAVGREDYYTRELATDHEQYLSGHGESPGHWYGAGATTLGLQQAASGTWRPSAEELAADAVTAIASVLHVLRGPQVWRWP